MPPKFPLYKIPVNFVVFLWVPQTQILEITEFQAFQKRSNLESMSCPLHETETFNMHVIECDKIKCSKHLLLSIRADVNQVRAQTSPLGQRSSKTCFRAATNVTISERSALSISGVSREMGNFEQEPFVH